MDAHFSKEFHNRCLRLTDRFITVVLKTGDRVEGVITAFALGNVLEGEPYIIHWRMVPEGRETAVVMDSLGNMEGQVICPEDIDEVHFREDKIVLKFPQHE